MTARRGRRRPSQARSRDTYAAVVEAGAQVFAAEGPSATTNRIAARAGVSIGSLYQYFEDKHAILLAVAERHLAEAASVMAPLLAALHEDPPPQPRPLLEGFFTAMMQLHGDRPLLHDLIRGSLPVGAQFDTAVATFEAGLAEQVAGYLARLPVELPDRQTTALLVVRAVNALSHRWIASPAPERDDQAFVRAASALLAGGLEVGGSGGG